MVQLSCSSLLNWNVQPLVFSLMRIETRMETKSEIENEVSSTNGDFSQSQQLELEHQNSVGSVAKAAVNINISKESNSIEESKYNCILY